MVVLGNLDVKKQGPGNFVSVGKGTQVLPNSGTDCLVVGGTISTDRDVQVFNQASHMSCNIIYKGGERNISRWKNNGQVRHDPNYDLSDYIKMKDIHRKKSKFWKTLPSTGSVDFENWGNPTGQTTYKCSSTNNVQVFNIQSNEHNKINGVHTIYFSDECEGKTVLINVHGIGNINVDAAAMHFKGKMGFGQNEFSTCLTSSILWNFPDASHVDIGNGRYSEFHGSVLVTGNMKLSTSGHSGRAIILGDVVHEQRGSEFHSYEFNPPYDIIDPPDICV